MARTVPMSPMSPMSNDQQIRGLLRTPTEEVRFVAIHATDTVEDARRRHGTGPTVTVLLGRTLMAGSLLATLTKGGERLTLQLTGDGPVGALVVDASSH